MAYITVDVDLDEFDTDDLIGELYRRHSLRWKSKSDSEDIIGFAEDILDRGGDDSLSIIDEQKIQFLKNNIDQINLEDLEKILLCQK